MKKRYYKLLCIDDKILITNRFRRICLLEIKTSATAGTMESSDIMIIIEKNDSDLTVELSSVVESLFGDEIRNIIVNTSKEMGLFTGSIKAIDRGALNCTIKARVRTAISRACEISEFSWS